jgi:hypothetical protein
MKFIYMTDKKLLMSLGSLVQIMEWKASQTKTESEGCMFDELVLSAYNRIHHGCVHWFTGK